MLRAAIDERNPSFNRTFVEPCARTDALYWTSFGNDDVGELRVVQREMLLREFVDNDNLDVRRSGR